MALAAERTNYRQVGRQTASARPHRASAPHLATSPAIPSCHAQPPKVASTTVKDGFGSKGARFSEQKASEQPEPYYCTTSLIWDCTSISKKGYGGFVSRVARFDHSRNRSTVIRPGLYHHNGDTASRVQTPSGCCSAFARPSKLSPGIRRAETAPGVGDYEVVNPTRVSHRPSAIFKSNLARTVFARPAPSESIAPHHAVTATRRRKQPPTRKILEDPCFRARTW
jgi:hypothetical protein